MPRSPICALALLLTALPLQLARADEAKGGIGVDLAGRLVAFDNDDGRHDVVGGVLGGGVGFSAWLELPLANATSLGAELEYGFNGGLFYGAEYDTVNENGFSSAELSSSIIRRIALTSTSAWVVSPSLVVARYAADHDAAYWTAGANLSGEYEKSHDHATLGLRLSAGLALVVAQDVTSDDVRGKVARCLMVSAFLRHDFSR